MDNPKTVVLPSHECDKDLLSNTFGDFYFNKIETRKNLSTASANDSSPNGSDAFCADIIFDGHVLYVLTPTSVDEIRKIISKACSKSSELDPLPASLLNRCLNSLAPIITSRK